MQVFSVQEPTPLIGEHNIPIWKNSGAVKRLWRPQWSAQRQRQCKYRSPLWISSATTNRLLYIRVKKLSRLLNIPTTKQKKDKQPLFKTIEDVNSSPILVHRSMKVPPHVPILSWTLNHDLGNQDTRPQSSLRFPGQRHKCSTCHQHQRWCHKASFPTEATWNEWVGFSGRHSVQVIFCHPLRSHTPDIVHDLIFRKCLVKQQPGPISHRASDQCRSTRFVTNPS